MASSISITPANPAPIVLSLTTTSVVGGIQLNWASPNDAEYFATEIWASLTNARAAATLVDTIVGNTYIHSLGSNQIRYYWIRGKSVFGRYGDWHPFDTSPVAGDTGWIPSISQSILEVGSSVTTGEDLTDFEDGVLSSTTTVGGVLDKILFYNFSFSINPTATLVDLEMKIKGKVSSAAASPYVEGRLTVDISNTFHLYNLANYATLYTSTYLTTTNTTYTYGGSTNFEASWGQYEDLITSEIRPYTMADILQERFGVVPYVHNNGGTAEFQFDYIAMKVYYTEGGGVRGTSGNNTNGSFTVNSGAFAVTGGGGITIGTGGGVITDNGNFSTTSGNLVSSTGSVILGYDLQMPYTNTATVGAVTINKASGRVNIAAAGTSVVVTNSLVALTSHVMAIVSTNDTTAYVKSVVPAAGSFTIRLGAAATAETSIDFVVFN